MNVNFQPLDMCVLTGIPIEVRKLLRAHGESRDLLREGRKNTVI